LRARAGDAPEEIARRMAVSRDEISHWNEFDHIVINDDLSTATQTVRSILHAARAEKTRMVGVSAFVQSFA
jgi:guanylate kinase